MNPTTVLSGYLKAAQMSLQSAIQHYAANSQGIGHNSDISKSMTQIRSFEEEIGNILTRIRRGPVILAFEEPRKRSTRQRGAIENINPGEGQRKKGTSK